MASSRITNTNGRSTVRLVDSAEVASMTVPVAAAASVPSSSTAMNAWW